MFGLVARFTLKPDMGDEFDLLTRQTVSRVHSEPGTLTYACHLVHSDPDARLFYELYRDRAAFEEHERTDHVRRFLAERDRCLAGPPEVEFLTFQTGKGVPSLE
jgi:quinol monooxygenase YgiN